MKIGFFGCSMTEGGGLNSPVWNEYAIKNNIYRKNMKDVTKSLEMIIDFQH